MHPQKRGSKQYAYVSYVLRRVGVILLSVGMVLSLWGCTGEDRYVEIVIAGGKGTTESASAAENAAKGSANISAIHQSVAPTAEMFSDMADTEDSFDVIILEESTPQPSDLPVPTPAPLITPEIVPEVIFEELPEFTVKPIITEPPVQTPAPTPEPTPDYEKLMQAELDDVYAEYVEEWDRLYKEYEERCAPLIQSIEMMGEPSEDPEYIAARAALEAEIDALSKEYAEKEEKLDAEYFALYSAVYDKYGK